MKTSIIVIMLLSQSLLAQKTILKEIKTKKNYEEYSVLADNKSLRHGPYFKMNIPILGSPYLAISGAYFSGKKTGFWQDYFLNGTSQILFVKNDILQNQINSEGYYKDDLKDSLWTYYFPEKNKPKASFKPNGSFEIIDLNTKIRAQGTYFKDKKIKTWNYFLRDGLIRQVYDYDNNNLIYDIAMEDSSEWANHDALLIGDEIEMNELLHDTFDFHGLMEKINVLHLKAVILIVEFTIIPDGTISNIHEKERTIENKKIIINSYKTIGNLKGLWLPKFKDGNPVESTKTISFLLGSDLKTYHGRDFSENTLIIDYKIMIN